MTMGTNVSRGGEGRFGPVGRAGRDRVARGLAAAEHWARGKLGAEAARSGVPAEASPTDTSARPPSRRTPATADPQRTDPTEAAAPAAARSVPRFVPATAIPDPADFTAPGISLRDAAGMFGRHPNARVLAATTAAAVAARVAAGRWSRRDAVTAAVVVGLEPFVEWIVHVRVLHRLPREVDGRVVDSPLARTHRAHHRDPRDPGLVFIPRPTLGPTIAALGVFNVAGARALRPALTGFATAMVSLTTYEWTHFLIHSAYRPKSALYRTIRRTHQLHHFRNENYWFGIITPVSDKVLGTYPAKDAVPASRTAKTLGVA